MQALRRERQAFRAVGLAAGRTDGGGRQCGIAGAGAVKSEGSRTGGSGRKCRHCWRQAGQTVVAGSADMAGGKQDRREAANSVSTDCGKRTDGGGRQYGIAGAGAVKAESGRKCGQ